MEKKCYRIEYISPFTMAVSIVALVSDDRTLPYRLSAMA